MAIEKVFHEHFKSLESLLETIEKRETNTVFKNRYGGLKSQDTSDYEFFETKNYQESVDLLKTGYKKPMDEIKRELVKITNNSPQQRRRTYNDFQGFIPHVPNLLSGHPQTMINREKRTEKTKTIHLVYGFSAIGSTKASKLIKGGIMFLGLVNALEKSGYRVKIDILRCTTASNTDAITYTCTVKEYNQNLNLLKLCYPLAHPSMLRRTSFKWCETLPKMTNKEYANGYGATLYMRLNADSGKERLFLKRNNILKENMFYCNVYEAMESKNIQELAEKIGISK